MHFNHFDIINQINCHLKYIYDTLCIYYIHGVVIPLSYLHAYWQRMEWRGEKDCHFMDCIGTINDLNDVNSSLDGVKLLYIFFREFIKIDTKNESIIYLVAFNVIFYKNNFISLIRDCFVIRLVGLSMYCTHAHIHCATRHLYIKRNYHKTSNKL